MTRSHASERGTVLVHMAISLAALLAVSALTVDFGVKWTARGQAQNAADAGALAGAIALAFDDPNDLTDTGMAKQSALRFAVANLVWGETPNVNVTTDVTFPVCPDGSGDTCLRVDVYRNVARGNPLPTYFAAVAGVTAQGVRATATGQVRRSSATNCLRPWAVVDRWDEFDEPGFPLDSTFDRYAPGGEQDQYFPPSTGSTGSGFTIPTDFGNQIAVRTDLPTTGSNPPPGMFRPVVLPRAGDEGIGWYEENIESCNGYPVGIAQPTHPCPHRGGFGTHAERVFQAARGCLLLQGDATYTETRDGIETLYNQDPNARWDPTINGGRGGIASSCCSPSPRIVPVAIMNVDEYMAFDPGGTAHVVRVSNIVGLFIEGMGDVAADGTPVFDPGSPLQSSNRVLIGRLVTYSGLVSDTPPLDQDAAFLRTTLLVR